MELEIYRINAFAKEQFTGNPACVVPLREWLPDELLLRIAEENAVAETAYYLEDDSIFHLRWFTPEMEMDLCGHATLATAHAIKAIKGYEGEKIIFDTRSGELVVRSSQGRYIMDLPCRRPENLPLPGLLKDSLNIQPKEVLKARDFVLVYASEKEVKDIRIDRKFFDRLELGTGGVIITAPGKDSDFVSRFFTPKASVFEDPVTGSAHCSLIPYWSEKLGKMQMTARQLSQRGGELFCALKDDRVEVAGNAITWSTGKIFL